MRWRRKGNEPAPAPQAAPEPLEAVGSPRGSEGPSFAQLQQLAATHLSPVVARRWLELLRPAIRLVPTSGGDPVVARLGGVPHVGPGFEWPVWEGHGPLSYVAEVDLAAVAALGMDCGLRLPRSGRLLAFYFDGSYDDFAGLVGSWEPESLAGARLLHVEGARHDCTPVATPDRVLEFGLQELTGRQVVTEPGWEHPALRRAFGGDVMDHDEWLRHPVNATPFTDGLRALQPAGSHHQLGGWADPVQGPVEYEVAEAALGNRVTRADDRLTSEALNWASLLQIDSDDTSEMLWGDAGMLYWVTRPKPSDPDDLAQISFTWQCS